MKVSFCENKFFEKKEKACLFLKSELEELIHKGADLFLISVDNSFEKMAVSVLWELKKEYPHIQIVYVEGKDDNNKENTSCCDWVVKPVFQDENTGNNIEDVKRYLIKNADVVIEYDGDSYTNAMNVYEYKRRILGEC